MHNVPQQAQSQPPYDAVSQYQSRWSAAQVLGSQFGTPQYYNPNDGTHVSGPAAMPQQYSTATYHPSMQYASTASSQPPPNQPRNPNAGGFNRHLFRPRPFGTRLYHAPDAPQDVDSPPQPQDDQAQHERFEDAFYQGAEWQGTHQGDDQGEL